MKEWYLETPPPGQTSGFEDDALRDYAAQDFSDVLYTAFSDEAELCSPDLSERRRIRCVIQGNTADTRLNSMEREVLAPIGTLKAGMYIWFEQSYWLIDGRPGNNKSYEKATLKLCQYKLKWQKDGGGVVERWCSLSSASKYDVGQGGNAVIFLTSNNYTVLIPHDADGQTVEDRRVFIDTSDEPRKVFRITRNDDPLFLYGPEGGVLSLIADKTELNPETDRPDLRLCDYREPEVRPGAAVPGTLEISGKDEVVCGFSAEYEASGADSGAGCMWNASCRYPVRLEPDGARARIYADAEDSIGSEILLECSSGGKSAGKRIRIVERW